MATMPSFRAFLSYSHDDRAIFDVVRDSLRKAGLTAGSDTALKPGRGFSEQIQTAITHAYVFVPILTPRSHELGWVHQEIGFAVAMRIPCVPICVGKLPDGMIAMSHAIVVNDDLAGLANQILAVDFAALVEQSGRLWTPPGNVADEPEVRARTIQQDADAAFYANGPSRVRIAGGFSTFGLPDEEPSHPKWTAAYGTQPRSQYSYRLSRSEYHALKRHVDTAGLGMIINLGLDLDTYRGPGVTRTRLCLLSAFLQSLTVSDELIDVVVQRDYPADLIVAVGDWFFAESRAAGVATGVLHTTFIAHAPTVSRRVAEFDRQLASIRDSQGIRRTTSRSCAIEQIQERIRELPPQPA